jgi:nucleotide-binding universal stress UspA family protein
LIRVLHLSDTQLSGSPVRIVDMLNRHAEGVEARHMVWHPTMGYRSFKTDLVSSTMAADEAQSWLAWADIIHFHNRWRRQEIFQKHGLEVPKRPAVIQVHSPRQSEDFRDEVASKLPLAIIAQYHVRQWPELSYIVPNVVDISDEPYVSRVRVPGNSLPTVSYAPSNTNAMGWDNKGYGVVAPFLKRLRFSGAINFQLLVGKPHDEVLAAKADADIGIDEVVTGSYHLSSLEYLAFGIPCIAHLDALTEKVVKVLTGAATLPWTPATRATFTGVVSAILQQRDWAARGLEAASWMARYWSPETLARHYCELYAKL